MKTGIKVAVVAALILTLAGSNVYAGPFEKLGRGLTNIILSPAELIYEPMKLDETTNSWVAWLGGVPKGIVFFPLRLLVGVWDAATFPLPIPGGYAPIMEPETLVEGFESTG